MIHTLDVLKMLLRFSSAFSTFLKSIVANIETESATSAFSSSLASLLFTLSIFFSFSFACVISGLPRPQQKRLSVKWWQFLAS